MPDSKVIARIFGGIGNQLFCYAAARRLALVNHAELVLDDVSGFVRDKYQRQYMLHHFYIPSRKARYGERLEPLSQYRRYLKRIYNQCLPFHDRSFIKQEGVDFDPRLLTYKSRGTVYLEGYWQSEGYFKDVETTIRQDLQIRPPPDAVNLAIFEQIRGRMAVAIHVRFFDEPQVVTGINAPTDYYARAVAEMERRVPNAHYFIFSDRPEAARSRIPLPDDRITLLRHNLADENAYADLWLMSQCQHFIIANSTFSWWGAWLSSNSSKLILVPNIINYEGKCAWGFSDLIPKEWKVI